MALFSQHNFDALYNCSAEDCEFEHLDSEVLAACDALIRFFIGFLCTSCCVSLSPASNKLTLWSSQLCTPMPCIPNPSQGPSYTARYYPRSLLLAMPNKTSSQQRQVHTFHGDRDGVYVVDRIGRADRDPLRWEPSTAGLIKLPDTTPPHGQEGPLNEQDNWAWYPGWWGARQEDTPQPLSLVCLFDDGKSLHSISHLNSPP